MSRISQKVDQIKPSASIQVSMRAMELRAQGKDVVSLDAGEPDFDTPKHIRQCRRGGVEGGRLHPWGRAGARRFPVSYPL